MSTVVSFRKDPAPDTIAYVLPEEMQCMVFGNLPPEDLAQAARVCQFWYALASDEGLWNAFADSAWNPLLKKLFGRLSIIDKSVWDQTPALAASLAAHGMKIPISMHLDYRHEVIPTLRVFHSLRIEGNAGVRMITIPEGMTFNILVSLLTNAMKWPNHNFQVLNSGISEEDRNTPVKEAYTFVITDAVLEDSRKKSLDAHATLLSEIPCDICEAPEINDALALLTLTRIVFKQRLLGDDPWTFTRCHAEKAVGGFFRNGVFVSSDFDDEFVGLMAMAKFRRSVEPAR